MLLHCHSKKCNTTRDHKLKVDTNEAVCTECSESNDRISDVMKSAMKASGELYRTVSKKSFMYRCVKCAIDRNVKIIDDKVICEVCLHPMTLSAPMIEVIKANIKSGETKTNDSDDEKKEMLNKGIVKRRKTSV
jgi:hypothetical protein